MAWLRHRQHRHEASRLAAYWDDLLRQRPAVPVPNAATPPDLAAQVRQLDALEEADARLPDYADALLSDLLAAYSQAGAEPSRSAGVPSPSPARRPARPGRPWFPPTAHRRAWSPGFSIAMTVVLLVATMGGAWLARDYLRDDELRTISFDGIEAHLEWQIGATAGFSDNICDIAVSNQGLVYVVDCTANDIKVFDASGALIDTWGSYGFGPGQFRFATPNQNQGGIDLDADGNIYVFDTGNNRVQKFSPGHEFLREWGTRGDGIGEFGDPIGAVDRARERVYVVDISNNRIQVFDLDGGYLDKWGERGDLNGQFQAPSAIAIGDDGTVYVADGMAQRIQHFDMTGVFLEEIGSPGQIGSVSDIAVYPDGHLVVASPEQGQLELFAPNGTWVVTILAVEGGGTLTSPRHVALDAEGKLYILESADIFHDRPGMVDATSPFATRVIKVELLG